MVNGLTISDAEHSLISTPPDPLNNIMPNSSTTIPFFFEFFYVVDSRPQTQQQKIPFGNLSRDSSSSGNTYAIPKWMKYTFN